VYKYSYFPLTPGLRITYEVDSINYNKLFSEGRDTFRFEMQEEILEADTDVAGREIYIVERRERLLGSNTWIRPKRGVRLIDDLRAELFMDNLRFVPMIFPPREGLEWAGNAFIQINDLTEFYEDWQYRIMSVDEPAVINGFTFDSTLTVLEIEDEGLLEYRFSQATYAVGVGLVELERTHLWFVGSNIPNLPWEQRATNGYITRWRVVDIQY
jgi:hypothetical protein